MVMMDVSPIMQALSLHQAGRLDEAAALYRAILGARPDEPDALHLLGLIVRRQGDPAGGAGLIRRALALSPGLGPALGNLADILSELGRPLEAAACLKRRAALQPDDAAGWFALGRAFFTAKRMEEAITAFGAAADRDPDNLNYVKALTACLQIRARHAEADARYQAWWRRQPANLVPFTHVTAQEWCRPVSDAAAMLAEPRTIWTAEPARTLPTGAPDYYLDDDPLTAPGFVNDTLVDMRRHVQEAGPAFVAHFENLVIERTSRLHGGRSTFNVFAAPGAALADAYHNKVMSERLLSFTGERAKAVVMGREIALDLCDAVPPDQIVAKPGLLMASRYTQHNYFHWIFEGVARLWCLEALPDAGRLALFVHADADRAYHRDVLAALNVRNPMIPLTGDAVLLKRAYFPSFLAPGSFSAPQIDWLRRRLMPAFGAPMWPQGGRRIYLSRADVAVRSLSNEAGLIDMLRRRGFEIAVPGRMSVAEQISLFSEAAVVVAPHGAGNTNMIFAPPGAALLELTPRSTGAILYWMTAKEAGQRYGRALCDEAPDGRLIVDVDRVAALLDQALAEP